MNTLLALFCLAAGEVQEPKPKEIVLIAGSLDTHPKDTHEYERNIILLKHCLLTSLKNIRVETHFGGWPADPSTLGDADTIFFTSGGSERGNAERNPIYVGDRLSVLEKQMARGCGLIQFHWSTFNPVQYQDRILEWVGGFFDAESGPDGKWYSKLSTREWQTRVATPDHPIARGVRPFTVKEEFYYNLRFRDGDPRLKPILVCSEGTVGYAVERPDGGRGFGFTGGHFFANWWNPDFRKLLLNAIAWTAKIEVPPPGVESTLEDPLRVTILTGHHYPAHEWKITTPALIQVVEQDPRVRITVAEDVGDLQLENQHVLVINYMNWGKPGLTDDQKQALVGFFERGGGLVVFHGATGVWNSSICPKESEWPEFRDKITARWWASSSGHDDFGPVRVEIVAPDHEITRGLGAFDTQDELYVRLGGQNGVPLVAAQSKVAAHKEPLAWAHSYGKGRVFVTALGHGVVSIRSAGALFRRATVWATGAPPLAFDPPTAGESQKTIDRPGTWKPKN
jgi:type 1 glutamine amidotransferase